MLGGGEAVAYHFVNLLSANKFEVTLCSNNHISIARLRTDALRLGVKFAPSNNLRLYRARQVKFFQKTLMPYNIVFSKLAFAGVRCDYYINTAADQIPLIPYPRAFLDGNIPALFYIHWVAVGMSRLNKPWYILLRKTFNDLLRLIKNRAIILTNSNYTAKQLENEVGLRPTLVVYPPVNIDECKYDGRAKENIAVTIGRISPEKKFEIIIKSMPRCNLKKLIIIGNLRDKAYLERLRKLICELKVQDRVEIFPSADRSFLVEMLKRAKLYIHGRSDERFGISVVEAMSAGCLTLVPDRGGPAEYVPKVLQYKAGDHIQLASLIDHELNCMSFNPCEISSMALQFSPERFYKTISGLLDEIC